jgi:hypothetical protein
MSNMSGDILTPEIRDLLIDHGGPHHTVNSSPSATLFVTTIDKVLQRKCTYTVKKLFVIPVPSRDVTYQTLPGRE